MKKNILIGSIVVILSGSALAFNYYGGRCSGTKYCSACKNCSGCKHCAKEGGTCGVCK